MLQPALPTCVPISWSLGENRLSNSSAAGQGCCRMACRRRRMFVQPPAHRWQASASRLTFQRLLQLLLSQLRCGVPLVLCLDGWRGGRRRAQAAHAGAATGSWRAKHLPCSPPPSHSPHTCCKPSHDSIRVSLLRRRGREGAAGNETAGAGQAGGGQLAGAARRRPSSPHLFVYHHAPHACSSKRQGRGQLKTWQRQRHCTAHLPSRPSDPHTCSHAVAARAMHL